MAINECTNKGKSFLLHLCLRKYILSRSVAGWSSLVARQAHNLKVAGSNPAPAPNFNLTLTQKKIISPKLVRLGL